ncbi:unnamed protein product [Brugia pahangi]|uniref:H15 domain-containing protein n=1 Tax=Brugia pahangi TaxID=6280 RepID=A0A0N4TTK5_BRUPA|nr:unnamed protein product [Brugia pahangi]
MEAAAIELPSPPRISGPTGKSPKKRSAVQGTSKARSKRQGAKVMKNHPSYSQMIKEAIVALKDRKGSSRVAILKYISGHYQLGDNGKRVHSQLRLAIKKGIASGKLTLAKGAGVNGSFRLGTATDTKTKRGPHKQKEITSKKEKKSKVTSAAPKKPRVKKVATAKSPKQKPKTSNKPKKSKVSKPKKTAS